MGVWAREANASWSKHDLGKQSVSHCFQGKKIKELIGEFLCHQSRYWGIASLFVSFPFKWTYQSIYLIQRPYLTYQMKEKNPIKCCRWVSTFFFPFCELQDFKVGILQGRTVDMKTLTLIEEPTEEVKNTTVSRLCIKYASRCWRRQKMSLKGFWMRQNNWIICP